LKLRGFFVGFGFDPSEILMTFSDKSRQKNMTFNALAI
jgi:hypothetical protein